MAGKGCKTGDKTSHFVICWRGYDQDTGDYADKPDVECKTIKLARKKIKRLQFNNIVERMSLYRVTVTKVEDC